MCIAGIEVDVNTVPGRAGLPLSAATPQRMEHPAPSRAAIFFGAMAFTAALIGALCLCDYLGRTSPFTPGAHHEQAQVR